jgi:hypothetical protein
MFLSLMYGSLDVIIRYGEVLTLPSLFSLSARQLLFIHKLNNIHGKEFYSWYNYNRLL